MPKCAQTSSIFRLRGPVKVADVEESPDHAAGRPRQKLGAAPGHRRPQRRCQHLRRRFERYLPGVDKAREASERRAARAKLEAFAQTRKFANAKAGSAGSDILIEFSRPSGRKSRQLARPKALDVVKVEAEIQAPARDFVGGLDPGIEAGRPAVIAEIKEGQSIRASSAPTSGRRKSPQATLPTALPASVLTGPTSKGCPDYLPGARAAVPGPAQGFHDRSYQVHKARAMGAVHPAHRRRPPLTAMEDLEALAGDYRMAVLVEVPDNGDELDLALRLESPLVSINNRNLPRGWKSLWTPPGTPGDIPKTASSSSPSGILATEDVALMRKNRVNAFLVGEAFIAGSRSWH